MKQPRIVLPGYPHHVTVRGNNRRRLFSYQSDYKRMLWDIGRALNTFEVVLNALVLMTNHVHLILIPRIREALPRFMKSFEQRYAQYRNKMRGGSGTLFESRYFSVPIQSEAQLALTLAYVELNPVRAGICADPLEYRWSSHGLHVDREETTKVPPHILTPSGWYLGLGDDLAQRARGYSEWVERCRVNDLAPDHADCLTEFELLSSRPYTLRLERPDRSRASEADRSAPGYRNPRQSARLSSDTE